MVCTFGAKKYLIGLVSFGNNPCTGQVPGVYTSIDHFRPWIKSNLNGHKRRKRASGRIIGGTNVNQSQKGIYISSCLFTNFEIQNFPLEHWKFIVSLHGISADRRGNLNR